MQYAVIHAKETMHFCSCVILDPCNPYVTMLISQSMCHKWYCACEQLLSDCLLHLKFGKTQMEQLYTYAPVEWQCQRNTVALPCL